jgi:hypothetical protein
MLRCANAEFAFGRFWKLADGDAGHDINDSIAIIDCNSEVVTFSCPRRP